MNVKNISVSKHAEKRIKERPGKKIDPEKFAKLATERGLSHKELKGNLLKWVNCRVHYNDDAYPFIYDNYLLLFSRRNDVLITVLPVPSNLNKLVAKLLKKKADT